MFKTNFSGHNKIGEHGLRMPSLAMGLLVKQVSHLDENIAALCFWLNSSKSDDLRTNAFSTSTKYKSHEKIHFGFVGHHCRDITRSENQCIFYL